MSIQAVSFHTQFLTSAILWEIAANNANVKMQYFPIVLFFPAFSFVLWVTTGQFLLVAMTLLCMQSWLDCQSRFHSGSSPSWVQEDAKRESSGHK